MHLDRQAQRATGSTTAQSGYAMAALLVAMSVMAIMMTVVLPVWKQAAQREKEEELVFRGEQYARAVGLFQRKFANAYPPSIDVLVEQRFLRKKYKDPITKDDFVPLGQAQAGGATPGSGSLTASAPGQTATQPSRGGPGTSGSTATTGIPGAVPGGRGGAPAGGVIGVTSKSKDKSIRLYKGRSHYNEWAFVYTPPAQAPGAGVPGVGVPGVGVPGAGFPGGVPGGRGGRGQRGNQPPGGGPFGPAGPRGNQPGGGPFGPGGPRGGGPGGPGGANPFPFGSNPQGPPTRPGR